MVERHSFSFNSCRWTSCVSGMLNLDWSSTRLVQCPGLPGFSGPCYTIDEAVPCKDDASMSNREHDVLLREVVIIRAPCHGPKLEWASY